MAVDTFTCIMCKPISFFITLDANVRLHFDTLRNLAPPEAFSHGLYGSIKKAQVVGLPEQAWASQMFAQHIRCTEAVSGNDPCVVRVIDWKGRMKPDCLCSLDGVACPILVPNGIDTQLDAWANLRGWPIDPCAASIMFWFTMVPFSVDGLVRLPMASEPENDWAEMYHFAVSAHPRYQGDHWCSPAGHGMAVLTLAALVSDKVLGMGMSLLLLS